jgi:hypothetical protein
MKKVIIIGASGSLAQYVIETLQKSDNVKLTLFAGNLEAMAKNIVRAMKETRVKRIIAIVLLASMKYL